MVKSGLNFIIPLSLLGLVFMWESAYAFHLPFIVLGWLFFALAIFCVNFFRDPERKISEDPKLLVSPADGKVLGVHDVMDPYVGAAKEIRIFLNIFNVHVQRSPFTVASRVEGCRYYVGKFLAASVPKASSENEQHWIRLKSSDGSRVVVKQIAGLIARRIVSWVQTGDELAGGQHLGLIQFGSQVDLVVPRNWEIKVKEGDKVCGGESVLAERPVRRRRK